jgi:hypothetical protein
VISGTFSFCETREVQSAADNPVAAGISKRLFFGWKVFHEITGIPAYGYLTYRALALYKKKYQG